MIKKIGAISACALLAAVGGFPAAAEAAVVIYSAYDSAATGPGTMPNSDAAHAAFLAKLAGRPQVFTTDFETGPTGFLASYDLGGGGSLASTDQVNHPLSIRTAPVCTFDICGGDTTPGGHTYAFMRSGEIVFSFDAPVQAFGAYFSGVQFAGLKLTFNDGSSQSVAVPGYEGASFVGFTDFGHEISSISFKAPLDYVSIDDVTFALAQPSAAPEPAAWALMISGFGLAGTTLRLRRRAAA